MADFRRAEAAIEACEAHLAATTSFGTEIEAFLTRYLAVLVYSAYEDECRTIIEAKADRLADRHGASYVRLSRENVFRGIGISELGAYLAKFSPGCKSAFEAAVLNKPSHIAFDSLLAGRHATAHADGTSMTFKEFKTAFEKSQAVITAFETSLDDSL
jgi:hypothetical protein